MRPIVSDMYSRYEDALVAVLADPRASTACRLVLRLGLEELDNYHVGINPATNGSIARWRRIEEDLLNWLDAAGADGEYCGDPISAMRRIFDNRNENIIKLVTCVDEQAVIIEDLRQKLRQAQAAQMPPTVHVNGNGALSAASTPAAMPSVTFTVTPADEVDYPPTTAAKLPPTRVNWLGLPVDLQTRILQLDAGDITWRSLANTDRRAITLYAIPRVGGAGMSMSEWLDSKPTWMPTASALAQMFGLRWTELVAQAHKVMVE